MSGEQTIEQTKQTTDQTNQETDEQRQAREAAEAEQREQEETEKKPWFKKRFDEITRQKYVEAQRAEAAEKRATELEQRIKKLENKDAQDTNPTFTRPKPTLKEFQAKHDDPDDANEAYADALTDWKLEQHNAKIQANQQRQQQEQEQQRQHQTAEQKRVATVNAGKAKYNDWEQVVLSMPAVLMNPMYPILIDIKGGSDVAYYLGQNLQEAERISKLSPYAMAAEIGKIEQKLSNPEKKTTTAPEPVTTLSGKTTTKIELDPEKDLDAWVAARNRGEI